MQDVVGTQSVEVVRRLPRSRRVLQRPLRPPDQGADRHAGGAGRARLHLVPLDRPRAGARWARATSPSSIPPLHDLAVSDNPVLQKTHDTLLYLAPEPHRQTFLKPFHREQTAEFCSSCHKVHLDVPVNGYRWFRGFNDYDNWQASGVSGQGARSFYYPPKPQKCADCHMPLVASNDPAAKNGKIRSHRFAGREHRAAVRQPRSGAAEGGAGLPAATGRSRSTSSASRGPARRPSRTPARSLPAASRACRARSRSAKSRGNSARRQRLADAAGRRRSARSTRFRCRSAAANRSASRSCVRTRKVGHFFPGGTVDAFDVWVELEAIDDQGHVLLHSGAVADEGKGPVDPGAHFYRSLQLDEHGNVDQQAQRLVHAVGRLRAADSAGRRRHRPLPAADAGERRQPHHAARQGQLSQVRVVEHAVGVRRRPRSRAAEARRRARRTTMAGGCSPATRRTCPAR